MTRRKITGNTDWIHDVLDGSLSGDPRPPVCSSEARLIADYRDVIGRLEGSRPEVPEGLSRRVMEAIARSNSVSRPRIFGFLMPTVVSWRVQFAAGTAAALVLAACILLLQIASGGEHPVGMDDSHRVARGGALRITREHGVLANDSDPDTDHAQLTARLVRPPSHSASFSLASDGSFEYLHDGSAAGLDVFNYRPFDGKHLGNLVTVRLTVTEQTASPIVKLPSGGPSERDQFLEMFSIGRSMFTQRVTSPASFPAGKRVPG